MGRAIYGHTVEESLSHVTDVIAEMGFVSYTVTKSQGRPWKSETRLTSIGYTDDKVKETTNGRGNEVTARIRGC